MRLANHLHGVVVLINLVELFPGKSFKIAGCLPEAPGRLHGDDPHCLDVELALHEIDLSLRFCAFYALSSGTLLEIEVAFVNLGVDCGPGVGDGRGR